MLVFRNAELLSEVASLRTKLKSSRAKLKDSEGKLSGVVHMKADYERIQNSLKSDLYSLKERVSAMWCGWWAVPKCCVLTAAV